MDTEKTKSIFNYDDGFKVTSEVLQSFEDNGYVVLRGLLDNEEVTKLRAALENDEGLMTKTYTRDDGMGRHSKTCLWNQPGNDITGMVARSEKVAGTMEELLQGEVYHYHSKVILKEAHTGGAHVWHQDYGYWYHNGCLFPNMATVWIAVDKADKENGCVQFLSGSHKFGRIDHVQIGEHVGADLERLEHCKKICPLRYAELEPGDAMFFHANVLHCSAQNSSDRRRWGFLVAYNRADNNPVKKHHHPFYTPLNKVPNSRIRECDIKTNMNGKDFFGGPKEDTTLFALKTDQSKN